MLEHLYHCFPQGRYKALTLSYDDGKTWDRRLVQLLNQHGLKAAFNLNGDKFDRDSRISANEVVSLYQGHEVAAHSLTHPTLTRCPPEHMAKQILDDRHRLEDLWGAPVRGFAYPNGKTNPALRNLLASLGMAYARTTACHREYHTPEDAWLWGQTCHHRENLAQLTDDFLSRQKSQYLDVLSVWGHSYDFEAENNWHIMEDFAARLANVSDVWNPTPIELFDYQAAQGRLQFTVDCRQVFNPSAQSVWLRIDTRQDKTVSTHIVEALSGQNTRLY